jgi:NAD+ diphosphatase
MSNDFKILFNASTKKKDNDLYFTIIKGNILVNKEKDTINIPTRENIKKLNIQYESEFFLGEFKGKSCFAIEPDLNAPNLHNDFELLPLYDAGALLDEELFLIIGRANQILNWDKTHKFCGKCGSKTKNKEDEMAKICTSCGSVMYPVICPAIIVAVTRGDEILLAHNKGFKNNMYSLIAGFVEAGEDLESAVKREVFEEIGIKIKNIRYFESAPWSFPNSLMAGFFAEYESGVIKVDGNEIMDADWFKKDNFPNIPQKFTLARKIIDKYIDKVNSDVQDYGN